MRENDCQTSRAVEPGVAGPGPNKVGEKQRWNGLECQRNPKSDLRNPKEIRNPNALEHFPQLAIRPQENCLKTFQLIAGSIPTFLHRELRRELGMITPGGGLHFCGFVEAVPKASRSLLTLASSIGWHAGVRTGARAPWWSELECRILLRSSAFGFLSDLGFRAFGIPQSRSHPLL
jgi:hypothetical protein